MLVSYDGQLGDCRERMADPRVQSNRMKLGFFHSRAKRRTRFSSLFLESVEHPKLLLKLSLPRRYIIIASSGAAADGPHS